MKKSPTLSSMFPNSSSSGSSGSTSRERESWVLVWEWVHYSNETVHKYSVGYMTRPTRTPLPHPPPTQIPRKKLKYKKKNGLLWSVLYDRILFYFIILMIIIGPPGGKKRKKKEKKEGKVTSPQLNAQKIMQVNLLTWFFLFNLCIPPKPKPKPKPNRTKPLSLIPSFSPR